MHKEKIHVQERAQRQRQDSEPRKSFTDKSSLWDSAPKPWSPRTPLKSRTEGGEGALDSVPKTACPQQISSRKVIPLGSMYLEVQFKYDRCLENELSLPWQMSFLSVLNLKGISVLGCLENVTPYSRQWVVISANLKPSDSPSGTGSWSPQEEEPRQKLGEQLVRVEMLTNRGWHFQRGLLGAGVCLSLSSIV